VSALAASGADAAPLASVLLPLASGAGYVVAVLFIKRASAHGVGLWRTAFVSNVAMGLCFSPLWLLGGRELVWTTLWQPAVGGALFLGGQVFTFMAMAGDVSLATPVLGLKILFVAAASALLVSEPVRPAWWVAAALGTAAIALLQSSPRSASPAPALAGGAVVSAPPRNSGRQSPRRTIICAALAAACFAISDVLVQRFASSWGAGRYLPFMFGFLLLFSFALIPFFTAPLRALPRAAWLWLAPGSILLAIQATGMAYSVGAYGRATVANILYSTRGLWSVLAIGLLGAWLGTDDEQNLPRAVLRRRLLGSGLMFAAIALVIG
jgi:drug/metabolite transporter (DMT)-like permease